MYSDMLLEILIPLFGSTLWTEYETGGYVKDFVICSVHDPTNTIVGVLADTYRAHRSPMVPRNIFERYSVENLQVLTSLDFSFERYRESERIKIQLNEEYLERERQLVEEQKKQEEAVLSYWERELKLLKDQEERLKQEEKATFELLKSEGLI